MRGIVNGHLVLVSLVDKLVTYHQSVRILFLNRFFVINAVKEAINSISVRKRGKVEVPAVGIIIIIKEKQQLVFMHSSKRKPPQSILLQIMYQFLLVMLMC